MSSGSESDEDYVPKEVEQLSEEESADDETEAQYDNEVEQNTKKRKAVQRNTKKKKKLSNGSKEESKQSEVAKEEAKPEEEKKREDDLWAMFLEGTDTKPKTANNSKTETQPIKTITKCDALPSKNTTTNKKDSTESDKEKERRIFEFAGETIIVENNVIKEKIKASETSPSASKTMPSKSRGGAGLSNVLGQLNKKNKLSTLEKSKLDWDTFKKAEDIEAEIQSHNKGKQGYLERQDFLARADERQYEIERDLRISKRSNR